MAHRWTIKELNELTNKELIKRIILERRESCDNPSAPLYQRLTELKMWVENNL